MTKFKVVNIFGIPIYLDLTVGLLMAYVCFFFGGSLEYRLIMAVMLPISILFHELAHSLVGKLFGGRILEINLYLLGGRALMAELPRKPWQEFLVALAGPLMSIFLGGIFLGAHWVLLEINPEATKGTLLLWDLFVSLMFLNFGLAVFNLVPAFPLDGGRMLRSVLQWCRYSRLSATSIAVTVGQVIAVFWVTLWISNTFFDIHFDFSQWDMPTWLTLVCMYLFSGGGLLLPLIAYMIWVSGTQELRYVEYETRYSGDDQ
jgi:Zn-dependent protease